MSIAKKPQRKVMLWFIETNECRLLSYEGSNQPIWFRLNEADDADTVVIDYNTTMKLPPEKWARKVQIKCKMSDNGDKVSMPSLNQAWSLIPYLGYFRFPARAKKIRAMTETEVEYVSRMMVEQRSPETERSHHPNTVHANTGLGPIPQSSYDRDIVRPSFDTSSDYRTIRRDCDEFGIPLSSECWKYQCNGKPFVYHVFMKMIDGMGI